MENELFFDIGIIFIVVTLVVLLAKRYKQPLIPAYILSGVLLGPFLTWVITTSFFQNAFPFPAVSQFVGTHLASQELIFTLSEIGIAFLLFIVGLEINFKHLRDVGKISTVGGLLQMGFLFPIAYFLAYLMGFTSLESIYVGIIIIFSSTMVVLKILSDKREIDTLHGKIIIGIMLIQDLVAIFTLLALSMVGESSFGAVLFSILRGVVIVVSVIFISQALIPRLFKFAAKHQELLFLSSLATCFLFSIIFEWAGFSIAVGAFIAGVMLGNLPYQVEVIGRIASLRDFFATLFFVSLGMNISFSGFSQIILPLLVLMLFVMVIKPLLVLFITLFFGYTSRTSFLTGMYLGQLSEFSLIIVAHGMLLGHVSSHLLSLTILLATISIATTSYLIKYQQKIYGYLSADIEFLEKRWGIISQDPLLYLPKKNKHDVLLCGYDRTGYSILHKLLKLKRKILVLDYNPHTIKRLASQKIPCMYGDCANPEIIEAMDLKHVRLLISTITSESVNILLISKARASNPTMRIIVSASYLEEALLLYEKGADYVIIPHFLGGEHVAYLLENIEQNINSLVKTRKNHIKEIAHRIAHGHH